MEKTGSTCESGLVGLLPRPAFELSPSMHAFINSVSSQALLSGVVVCSSLPPPSSGSSASLSSSNAGPPTGRRCKPNTSFFFAKGKRHEFDHSGKATSPNQFPLFVCVGKVWRGRAFKRSESCGDVYFNASIGRL